VQGARSKTPPLVYTGLGAVMLWLLPFAYGRIAGESTCAACGVVAQIGAYCTLALGVLGLVVGLVLHGWLRTLQTGEDCCWMRLCGADGSMDGSMRLLRAVLWLVDSGPAKAGVCQSRCSPSHSRLIHS
jgi:hypothetical protein